MTSADDRNMRDMFLVCSPNQRLSDFAGRHDVVVGVQAYTNRDDVLLAIMRRPVAYERFRCVSDCSHHPVFLPAIQDEPKCRKLMRSVPIHYGLPSHGYDISNHASAVPFEVAA